MLFTSNTTAFIKHNNSQSVTKLFPLLPLTKARGIAGVAKFAVGPLTGSIKKYFPVVMYQDVLSLKMYLCSLLPCKKKKRRLENLSQWLTADTQLKAVEHCFPCGLVCDLAQGGFYKESVNDILRC